MATVDRALIAAPKLRACILKHRARDHFIFPRAAVPSDFEDFTSGSLRPSLDVEGRYPIRKILNVISDVTGVTIGQITSERRTKALCRARFLAYWLCRHHTGFSLPRIGAFLGNKDHTTVLHGCRQIERVILAEEVSISDDLHVMTRRLWATAWARKAA